MEESKKIRRHWLLITLICYFAFPLIAVGVFTSYGFVDGAAHTLTAMILSIPLYIALIYSAYKKQGTKPLTILLIITLLFLCLEFIGFVLLSGWLAYVGYHDPLVLANTLLSIQKALPIPPNLLALIHLSAITLSIWWVVASFKLRSINKTFQETIPIDTRIRRDWLAATLWCSVGYLYSFGLYHYYLRLPVEDVFSFLFELWSLTQYFILFAIPLLYYCAFKKPGSKLLSFVLIIQVIVVLFSTLNSLIIYPHVMKNPGELLLNFFSLFIFAIFQAWWLLCSYRLLKINEQLNPDGKPNKWWLIATAVVFLGYQLFSISAVLYILFWKN